MNTTNKKIDNVTYYKCEKCNGTGVIGPEKGAVIGWSCSLCNGTGIIDWVTNITNTGDSNKVARIAYLDIDTVLSKVKRKE